jgi:anti-sigma-K factor RskA
LWLIAGGNAPVSLGVLPDSGIVALAFPVDLKDQLRGATLAISDEPDGGSPTGQPTGAVLATGVVSDAV